MIKEPSPIAWDENKYSLSITEPKLFNNFVEKRSLKQRFCLIARCIKQVLKKVMR